MKGAFFLSGITSIILAATIGTSMTAVSAAELQWIGPAELMKLIENKDPSILIVDTQPKEAYNLGHIKGAINFPWAMDIQSPEGLPPDKILILYCDCVHSDASESGFGQSTGQPDSCSGDDATEVANQLMIKFGYKNIRILEGGWSGWQQLGYPVDQK